MQNLVGRLIQLACDAKQSDANQSKDLRSACIQALASLDPNSLLSLLPSFVHKDEICIWADDEAISEIARSLRTSTPHAGAVSALFSVTAYPLGQWTEKEVIETIVALVKNAEDDDFLRTVCEYLEHEDAYVRRTAASVLAKLGDEITLYQQSYILPYLLRALKDSDTLVRCRVCYAMGSIGDPCFIPYLVESLNDPEEAVREVAATALLQFGPKALEPLVAIVATWPPSRGLEAADFVVRQIMTNYDVSDEIVALLRDYSKIHRYVLTRLSQISRTTHQLDGSYISSFIITLIKEGEVQESDLDLAFDVVTRLGGSELPRLIRQLAFSPS